MSGSLLVRGRADGREDVPPRLRGLVFANEEWETIKTKGTSPESGAAPLPPSLGGAYRLLRNTTAPLARTSASVGVASSCECPGPHTFLRLMNGNMVAIFKHPRGTVSILCAHAMQPPRTSPVWSKLETISIMRLKSQISLSNSGDGGAASYAQALHSSDPGCHHVDESEGTLQPLNRQSGRQCDE